MTPTEFNECVDEYADALYRYCIGLTRSPMDADDLVQTSFGKMWEHREGLNKKAAKNWLYRTAYHAMIDNYRKVKRAKEYQNSQKEIALEMHQEIEYKDLLEQALIALTPEQKNLVLLRDYEGYTYKELCEITGLTMPNVKIILYRSRKKLKKKLLELDFKSFKKERDESHVR